jgi:hypothetical protein
MYMYIYIYIYIYIVVFFGLAQHVCEESKEPISKQ